MTVNELMMNVEINPDFQGITTADDFVLAVGFGSAATPGDYIVAEEGVTELSGALEALTADSQYLRKGKNVTKTGTSRTFTLSGEVFIGDPFQDAMLAHDFKYGIGQTVIKPYVYFNMLTGKGEQGSLSIAVEDDPSGAAGENAGISATMTSRGTPTAYTYTPPTPPSGG